MEKVGIVFAKYCDNCEFFNRKKAGELGSCKKFPNEKVMGLNGCKHHIIKKKN